MYSVHDVSEKLKMSKHTIRYYTDQGLIPNLHRDQYNNRVFDEASMNWLIGVRCLKKCGMSIADIRSYNQLCLEGDETIEKRYDIILKQRDAAAKQLKEAQERVQYLENKLVLYDKIKKGQLSDTANPDTWPKQQLAKEKV